VAEAILGHAILFHWSMALLVIGLAGLELYMVTLPDAGFDSPLDLSIFPFMP